MITKKKEFTVIFVVFILFFSLINNVISSRVLADESDILEDAEEPKIGIGGLLFKALGKFLAQNVFIILRLSVTAVGADPPVIEIGYNETVNFEIGMINVSTGDFEIWYKEIDAAIFNYRFVDFEVIEYPGGNDKSSWFVTFNPSKVHVEKGLTIKTNVTVTLTSPPVGSNAIQSGLLTFKIVDSWALGNVWVPPKGLDRSLIEKFLWFFMAVTAGFGTLSGKIMPETKNVSVLVKVKPYHFLEFDAVPTIFLKPDQVTSIPINLRNLGNYNDTFNFRIISEHDEIKLSNPISVTLAPGEIKDTYLGISVPQSAFDYGTFHQITIEAYSIYDPNVTIAEQTVFIETRGIYISEMAGIGLSFFSILLILCVAFYIHRRRLFIRKYCKKPDKPWEIPEEKRYLERLKKTDEKKYNEVFKMMEDEYDSALLWHKHYCKNILETKAVKKKEVKKEKIKERKIKKPKKQIEEEKDVEEVIKPVEKKEIKEEKPLEPKKQEKDLLIDKKAEAEKRRREQALSRIKHDQEKQRKKFRKGEK